MERKNKFAVLAIGTEVTSGQIVNKNTAWLSEQMEKLGYETVLHVAVPDDHDLIIEGLKSCTRHAEVVFTCGGLGPTTDDFTRDVIAEFLGRKLIFDQNSLDRLTERMKSLGRMLVDSQRQQCYYPESSEILWNSSGTANGFFCDAKDFKIAVLPGPPLEVASVWEGGLKDIFVKLANKGSKPVLRKWNCMGSPEAELAEIVERIVKGSKLKTGYRLNAPYVEVKLWCESKDESSQIKYFDEIEKQLKEWIVLREDEDPWEDFWQTIKKFKSVGIVDEASDGLIATKLSARLRAELNHQGLPELILISGRADVLPAADLQIQVGPFSDVGSLSISFKTPSQDKKVSVQSPFKHSLTNERSRLAAAELTILSANQFLVE